jgi:Tol biopolymer transport system component
VPEAVSVALARALAKNPADRFATPAEFIAALDQPAPAPGSRGRMSPLVAAVSLAVVVLAGVAGVRWLRQRPAAQPDPVPMTLRQVTVSQAVEEYPALSSDGRRLVFSRDVAGHRQLFLRELPDGPERQLTEGEYDNIQATWTPDQRAVLFVRAGSPLVRLQPGDVFGEFSGGDVWRLDVESGAEERLIEDAYDPAASPDGRRIAFDATRSGTRRIWITDEKGRNAQQVSVDS